VKTIHIQYKKKCFSQWQLTFSYAASKNSTGVFPKLMAWPKNGIVEGM